jgi:hypothetical protein
MGKAPVFSSENKRLWLLHSRLIWHGSCHDLGREFVRKSDYLFSVSFTRVGHEKQIFGKFGDVESGVCGRVFD